MASGDAREAPKVLLHLQPDPELDPDACDRLTRTLRAEIADLDVESASLVANGHTPDGTKGADMVTIGAIALAMSSGTLPAVIAMIGDWLARQAGRHRISVTIDGDTIDLDRASPAVQRELIDAYLRRHSTE